MDGILTPLRIPADSWSTTEVRSITHTHLWTIKGFSQCECRYLETTAKIKDISATPQPNLPSSSGGLPDLPVITFRIRLHPQGNKESNKDFTFFQCFSNQNSTTSNTPSYKAKFKFTVFNSRAEETPTTVYSGTQQLHGYFEYIRRDVLISHVQPSDELQLSLNITVTFDTITKVVHNMKPAGTQPPKPVEVTRDLENLLRSGKHTDFTLVIDDQEMKTHRTILAARSPVFAAMLEPHTEESQTGRVILRDIDYDVMYDLLYYMYTGKCPTMQPNTLEILAAADRFQLPGLKDMADVSLRNSLTVDSVCRHLVYADMYTALELRKEAIKFIVYNANAVTQTDGFRLMSKDHPALMTEIFQSLANDRQIGPSQTTTITTKVTDTSESNPPVKRARMSDV
ncbi:unnamed protein product [Caenorhabditis angaria]|uniref:BTB domain-containing protein n=1 Tax=Caenorhabditis angaria TaxID=860376 RepID=A0A9P1IAT5_9PELO|nr:unnamed protein product [Caenorhabditis angaria]